MIVPFRYEIFSLFRLMFFFFFFLFLNKKKNHSQIYRVTDVTIHYHIFSSCKFAKCMNKFSFKEEVLLRDINFFDVLDN